jgi:hypothetical protein
VPIAYGPKTAGTYARQYQEGGTDRHFRTTTTDLAEARRMAREFHDDRTWPRRHVRHRLTL